MKNTTKNIKKILLSSLGNMFEWYDYTLYIAFGSVFAKIFFPESDAMTSMINIFSIFAIGYIARPIGGLIFGYISDTKGRKKALDISITIMSLSVVSIGLLPTYEKIGSLSTILLIILRIIQGLSLGGEFSSSTVYIVENAPKGKKALFGSFIMLSLAIGISLGNITSSLISFFINQENLIIWGWRIPFIASFLILLLIYSFRNLKDEKIERKNNNIFLELIKHHKAKIAKIIFIACSDGIPFYIFCIFIRTYLQLYFNYSQEKGNIFGFSIIIVYGFSALLGGLLSDKYKNIKIMRLALALIFILSYPIMYIIIHYSFIYSLTATAFITIAIGLYHGSLPSYLCYIFPKNIRTTGLSVSYNIAIMAFGSTAPLVSSLILSKTGSIQNISFYLMISASISFLALIKKQS